MARPQPWWGEIAVCCLCLGGCHAQSVRRRLPLPAEERALEPLPLPSPIASLPRPPAHPADIPSDYHARPAPVPPEPIIERTEARARVAMTAVANPAPPPVPEAPLLAALRYTL